MNHTVIHAITRLGAINGALSCAHSIRPDMTNLNHSDFPVVILTLMGLGVRTVSEIFDYLDEHNAPFDLEDLTQVLFAHQGADPSCHLWRRADDGSYTPLISVG